MQLTQPWSSHQEQQPRLQVLTDSTESPARIAAAVNDQVCTQGGRGTSGKCDLHPIQITTDHQSQTGWGATTQRRQHRGTRQVGGVSLTRAVVTVDTDIAAITVHGKVLHLQLAMSDFDSPRMRCR